MTTEMPSSGLTAVTKFPPLKGFDGAVLDAKSGYVLPYRIKIATNDDDSDKEYPVFLLLHGMGRKGANNRTQIPMAFPLVKKLEEIKADAIIVLPQTVCGVGKELADGSKPVLNSIVELLDYLIANKSADPQRIYVLGESMGCGGVWSMVYDNPGSGINGKQWRRNMDAKCGH